MNNGLIVKSMRDNAITVGSDGISLPSPGEPDQGVKNFFWECSGVAVLICAAAWGVARIIIALKKSS